MRIELKHPAILVAYHPVTLARDTVREADALFRGFGKCCRTRFCSAIQMPMPAAANLIERARTFAASRDAAHVFVNLDALTYWSLLKQVDVLVGNSSSGIMESASFALPT